MILSEKAARRINKYTINLVRKLPSWLQKLFKEERVMFVLEDDGSLALSIDDSLEESKKKDAQSLISRYIEKHPSEVIQVTKVH